jgi:hypothetical protein
VWSYNLNRQGLGTWVLACASAPWAPRARHSSVVFQDSIILAFGETNLNSNSLPIIVDEMWISDPSNSPGTSWRRITIITPFVANRRSASFVNILDQSLLLVGGISAYSNDRFNDVWQSFGPTSLNTISWQLIQAQGLAPFVPRSTPMLLMLASRILLCGDRAAAQVHAGSIVADTQCYTSPVLASTLIDMRMRTKNGADLSFTPSVQPAWILAYDLGNISSQAFPLQLTVTFLSDPVVWLFNGSSPRTATTPVVLTSGVPLSITLDDGPIGGILDGDQIILIFIISQDSNLPYTITFRFKSM